MERLSFQGTSVPTPVTIDQKCPTHKDVFMQKIHLPSGVIKTVCPECVNEEIIKHDRSMVEMRLQKIKEITTTGLFERESDLNPELKEATFDSFIAENTSEKRLKSFGEQIASYYEKGGNGNTIFYGGSGVGKSHIAISILKQLNKFHQDFRIDKSVLFISVEALMARIKDSFKNKESRYTEDNMLKLLTEVDYLVLDDLGTESKMSKKIDDANNWTQQFLFKVLDMRDTTIITSNLSEKDMRQIYNDKLVSRIFKGVGQKIFEVPEFIKSKRLSSFKSDIEFKFDYEEESNSEPVEIIPIAESSSEVDEKFNSFNAGQLLGSQIKTEVSDDKVLKDLGSSENEIDSLLNNYQSFTSIPADDPRMTASNVRNGDELPQPWRKRKDETDYEHFARVDTTMPVEYWFKNDTPNFDFLNVKEKQTENKSAKTTVKMIDVNPDEWNGMTSVPETWLRQDGETEEDWLKRLSDPELW